MTEALRVLLVLEAVGLVALPIAARALGRLPGGGLGLAKVLGLLLLTWIVWFAGSIGVPNGLGLAIGGTLALGLAGLLARRPSRAGQVPEEDAAFRRRLLIVCEALFAAAFAGGVLFFAFSPDVWGTEKPMDMMLVNATLASDSFPPHDPWLAGEQLNYYYLGHLAAGLLIRLTDVEPTAGYNVAMGALLALSVTASFALAATLAEAARRAGAPVRRPLLAGVAAVVALVLMGNLRGGYNALDHSGSYATFDWFAQSRVVPDTINEFPWFSFLVGDLHAHLIAIPLTLLALAFVAQVALHGVRWRRPTELFCAALAIGALYAVNSWSWPVLAGLLVLAVAPRPQQLVWAAAVVALGIVLIAPFVAEFDPNARGFALVGQDEREQLGDFAAHLGVMFGALLAALVAPLAGRLRGARHPLRVVVFGAAFALMAMSLLAGARLAGAGALAILLAVTLAGALSRRVPAHERLLWTLASGGVACLLGPEIAYVRDEFDGTEFVRMNTVFKLGFQAWILLALAAALALVQARAWLSRVPRLLWQGAVVAGMAVGLAYTAAGADARKQGFGDGPRLDGRRWLERTAPGDIAAVDWLRANTAGDAVLLEAVGDDYSPFGNARMSTYTGRPAVLGWQGHELQWSHSVGSRRADVQTLYTTPDEAVARSLLDAYRVAYVVVGPLERTTYGEPGAVVRLGRRVFERDGTAIYAYTPPPEREQRPAPPVLGG